MIPIFLPSSFFSTHSHFTVRVLVSLPRAASQPSRVFTMCRYDISDVAARSRTSSLHAVRGLRGLSGTWYKAVQPQRSKGFCRSATCSPRAFEEAQPYSTSRRRYCQFTASCLASLYDCRSLEHDAVPEFTEKWACTVLGQGIACNTRSIRQHGNVRIPASGKS